MRFDLSGEQNGVWFRFFESEMNESGEMTYLDPKEGAGEVRIREMDSDVMREIRAQTNKEVEKFIHNPKTRGMERILYNVQTVEQRQEENERIWDYVIQDWRGILDKDGNEIPCSSENKKLIMKKSLQFVWFASRCLQLVTRSNVDRSEDAAKNS
jgi:predicted ATP-dependent endonuclease of OLD family